MHSHYLSHVWNCVCSHVVDVPYVNTFLCSFALFLFVRNDWVERCFGEPSHELSHAWTSLLLTWWGYWDIQYWDDEDIFNSIASVCFCQAWTDGVSQWERTLLTGHQYMKNKQPFFSSSCLAKRFFFFSSSICVEFQLICIEGLFCLLSDKAGARVQ